MSFVHTASVSFTADGFMLGIALRCSCGWGDHVAWTSPDNDPSLEPDWERAMSEFRRHAKDINQGLTIDEYYAAQQ